MISFRGMRMLVLLAVFVLLSARGDAAERLKDIVTVQGVRTNQLIGYGLVVGLDGSGDQPSLATGAGSVWVTWNEGSAIAASGAAAERLSPFSSPRCCHATPCARRCCGNCLANC